MYGEDRGGGFHGGGSDTPPVQVGDEIEVTIEAVGEKGDGLAKINGFVLFIPGVKEGQHVKVRVTKVLRKVGFADVVGVGTEAPQQAEAASEAPAEAPEGEIFGEAKEVSAEDSETFGEEAPAEEAPAEEAPAEEAPAEEAPVEEAPVEEAPAEEAPAEEEKPQ